MHKMLSRRSLLSVAIATGLPFVAFAQDVTVTPPAGGSFVVNTAAGKPGLTVDTNGNLLLNSLTAGGAQSQATALCFNAVSGLVGACSTLPGGATGPTGPTGPQGVQGPTGPQGIQGVAGSTGAQGATGAQGPTGPQGIQGVTGPAGTAAAQGATGAQGPTGPQGIQGIAGPAGTAGAQGATGAQGPIGPTGPQGSQGPTGAAGAQGVTGLAGPTGAVGAQGPTGPQGIQGVAGPTGTAGAQGVTGAQGPIGPAGPQGSQGPTGAAGAQGVAGSAGPAGATGPTGATGATGATGVTGAGLSNGTAAGQIYVTGVTPFSPTSPQTVSGDVTLSSTAVTSIANNATAGNHIVTALGSANAGTIPAARLGANAGTTGKYLDGTGNFSAPTANIYPLGGTTPLATGAIIPTGTTAVVYFVTDGASITLPPATTPGQALIVLSNTASSNVTVKAPAGSTITDSAFLAGGGSSLSSVSYVAIHLISNGAGIWFTN